MAEKEKEKDEEVAEVSSNGDVMKEEKNVMVLEKPEKCGKEEVSDEASKEIVKDVKEGEEETNEAVENDQNGKEGNDKENVLEEDKEKETKKRRRGVSKSKEKDKKEKEKDIKDTKKEIKAKVVRKRKEPGTPAAATVGRPTRERKSVERFVISIEKELSKEFLIEKGHGTQLKDIPNVAYKLSKRKADDVLKMLHTMLFGRRGKNFHIKSNISQFSGFVWSNNEEKQKTKLKEKLDKCFKSRLLEFCELLDMPAKVTDKKEDLVARLLEFLEAPHATTDVLLAEKEKSSKGKRQKGVVRRSSSKSPSGKGLKKDEDSPKARRKRKPREAKEDDHSDEGEEQKDEEEQEDESLGSEGDVAEESGESDREDAEEKSEDEGTRKGKSAKKVSKNFPEKAATTKARKSKNATTLKVPKNPSKSSSKPTKTEEKPSSKAKVFSRKKSDTKREDKSSTPQKRKRDDKGEDKPSASKKAKSDNKRDEKPSTSRSPLPNGKTGKKTSKAKGGTNKKDKAGPTEEELRKAICDILKEVDFNTATFTDILKQLAAHFKTDLMPRKAEVKGMIQDELTKLADDADDEDDDDAEEGDEDEEDDK